MFSRFGIKICFQNNSHNKCTGYNNVHSRLLSTWDKALDFTDLPSLQRFTSH